MKSNREGIRIVIELKRDAVSDVVLNNLYKYSDLQTTFGANMLAINGGRPESLTLKDMVSRVHGVPSGSRDAAHQAPADTRRATAPTSWSAWRLRLPTSTK